jgi:hypothetical protein
MSKFEYFIEMLLGIVQRRGCVCSTGNLKIVELRPAKKKRAGVGPKDLCGPVWELFLPQGPITQHST